LKAELLTYSRCKGLFAGIDLDGTSVSQNSDDTQKYFGRELGADQVLTGTVDVPVGAVPFVKDVAHHFAEARQQHGQ
jgi:lipid-binding SYLF domain-containing protein